MTDKKNQKSSAKKRVTKAVKKVKQENEKGAKFSVLEEIFYDLNRSKAQIYKMNFFRGLFFGFGSALGATFLIALTVWLLGKFGDVFPPLADFINNLIDAMQSRR